MTVWLHVSIISPKDSQSLIIYCAKANNEGHHPFKKVISQNIEFLCKILIELN
jgi:hypothetical protein